jgi:hypothetical protein
VSTDVDAFLEHHGVKGQKWGIRNDTRVSGDHAPGVSRTVNRHAKKDATEFARAKAFFGEGAGTRRKLIKQTVESKTKNMPGYKGAFDHHLAKQNQAEHVSKAKRERKRKNTISTNKKRISAIARRVTHEPGTQAAFVAAIFGGAAYLHSPKGKVKLQASIRLAKNVPENVKRFINARKLRKFTGGSQKFHSDPKLNSLYNQAAKLDLNKPAHVDKAMNLLDDIANRRVDLGELTKKQAFG